MSTVNVTNTMNVSDLIHEAVIEAWINGWNTSETVVCLKDQFARCTIPWPSTAEYRTSPGPHKPGPLTASIQTI